MTIKTITALEADEGMILRNKLTGIKTKAVFLRIGESQEDWEEIVED